MVSENHSGSAHGPTSELTPLKLLGLLWQTIRGPQPFELDDQGHSDLSKELPHHIEEYEILIEKTSKILQELHLKRNALVQINVLPVEVMTQVLLDASRSTNNFVQHFPHACGEDVIPPRAVEWKSLMLVCHHWRSIILSAKLFWQNIIVSADHPCSTSSVDTFLARSHPFPVRAIYHANSRSCGFDLLLSLTANSTRTQQLVATGICLPYNKLRLQNLLKAPLPNLQYLAISIQDERLLNAAVSNLEAPQLRRLALERPLSIPHRLLHRLTHLSLFDLRWTYYIEDLINDLRSMFRLEKLILRHAGLQQRDAVGWDGVQSAWLPRLAHLQLIRPATSVAGTFLLLHKLELPDSTRIEWEHSRNAISQVHTIFNLPPQSILDRLTTLLVTDNKGNQIQDLSIVLEPTELPKLETQLHNLHTLISDWASIAMDYYQAPFAISIRVVHAQIILASAYERVIPVFERLENPIFPKVTDLWLWADSPKIMAVGWSMMGISQEHSPVTRLRPDGTKYVVHLRQRMSVTFDMDWMVEQFGDGLSRNRL